jgi:hypothetical protein
MPIIAPLVAIVALQGAWKPYTLRPGIRVNLPAKPVEQPRDPEAPTFSNWVSSHQGWNTLLVTHGTFPEDGTRLDQILQGLLLGLQEGGKGKIVMQKDLMLNGWPGVETRHEMEDETYLICRSYAMPGQCATFTIGGPFDEKLNAPAAKFFASIKLPPKVGQGPLKVAGPEFKPYTVGDTGVSIEFPNPPTLQNHDVPGIHKRKMSQYISTYVNRIFSIGHTDLEEDEVASMSPDEIAETLRQTHEQFARGLGVKSVKPVASKFAGRESFRSTYAVPKIFAQARVETVMIGRRAFFAMSLTPPVLAKSPEVEKFFASIKVE